MGPPPTSTPSPPWIPEDDLLLIKAIEGGASLESLAKGAVRFSRRFSFQELRDRWRSLLYDPAISAEASARVAELERSAGNSKERKRAEKREIEFESIRRCYYAANRKMQQLDPPDLLLRETDLDDVRRLVYGDAGHEFDHGVDLPVSDDDEANFDYLQYICTPPATPEGRETDEISGFGELHTSTDRRQSDLVAPSDHSLNFSEGQNLLMESDVKEIDKFGLGNLLPEDGANFDYLQYLYTPPATPEGRETDEISGYGELQTSTARRQLDFFAPSDHSLNFSEEQNLLMESDVKEIEKFGLGKLLFDHPVDTNVDEMLDAFEIESIETDMRDHQQLDSFPEIPDYLLSEDHMQEIVSLDSPVDVNVDQMLDGIEEQNTPISESVLDPHPELLLDSPIAVNEDELLDASQGIPLQQNTPISVSVLEPHPELPDTVICCTLNTEDLDVPFNDDVVFPRTRPSSSKAPIGKPLLSDNDPEIPSFSDVESLILDMDLIPEDQDMYPSREVEKYQHEDAKRAIIRLEQAARARMQRSIAAHGALAVLYGHHSKHYIKKPEVLLGRGTEESIVDIDLSTEGPANKISRKQAILKMDEGGVFHVTNLGKCLVSVDGKDVSRNQSLSLHSNCLIEIGRLAAFIFEVNQVRVDQYLDAISRTTRTRLDRILNPFSVNQEMKQILLV